MLAFLRTTWGLCVRPLLVPEVQVSIYWSDRALKHIVELKPLSRWLAAALHDNMDQPSLPLGLQSPPRLPYGGSKSRGLMSPAKSVGADGIAMTPVRSGSPSNLGAGQTLLQEGTGAAPGSPFGALYSPGMVTASPLQKPHKFQRFVHTDNVEQRCISMLTSRKSPSNAAHNASVITNHRRSAEHNAQDPLLATPFGKQSAGLLSPSRSPVGNPFSSSAGLMLPPSSTSMGLHAGSSAPDVTASPGLGLGLSGAAASLRQGMYAGTTVSSASQRLLFDDSDLHVPYSSLDPRAGSDTGAGLGADHRSAARMGRQGAPDALQGLERRADGRYEKKLSIVPDGNGEECGTEGDVAASHCQFESNTEFSEARSTARQLHQGWAGSSKGLMYSAGPELGRGASYMTRSSTGPAALPLAIGKELVPSAFYGQASHRARRAVAAALPTFHSLRSVTAVRAAKAENAEPPSTFALHTLKSTGRPITIGRVQGEKESEGSEARPIQGTARARRMYEAALAQVEGTSSRAGGSSSGTAEVARAGEKGQATKARSALPLKGLGKVLGGPKATIALPTADACEPDSSHSRGRGKSTDKHAPWSSSAGGGASARDSAPSSPRSHKSGTSGISRLSAPGSVQRSIASSGLATTERLAGLKRKMSLISASGGSASASVVGHRVGPDAVQMEMTLARNGPRIIAQVSASMQKQFVQPIDYCTGEVIQTVHLTEAEEKGGEQGDGSGEGGPASLHTPSYGSTAAPVHTAVAEDDPRLLGEAEFQSNPQVVSLETQVNTSQAPLPFALSAMGPPGSAGTNRERQLKAELLRIRTQQLLQPLQPLQLAIASSGAHAAAVASAFASDVDLEHASASPAAPHAPSAVAGSQGPASTTSLITPDRAAVGSTSRATDATAGRPSSSRGASKGGEGEVAAAPPAPRKEARKEKRFVLAEVSDGRRRIIFTTKEQRA